MRRIGRPAVRSYLARKAMKLDLLLGRVVAALAKGSDIAEQKLLLVASVRLDMIDNLGCDDEAALKAELTERIQFQLQAAAALPAR
jgi:hypothetical protein